MRAPSGRHRELILGLLAGGYDEAQILAAYPYLEPEDIRQALAYAAWRLEEAELRQIRPTTIQSVRDYARHVGG